VDPCEFEISPIYTAEKNNATSSQKNGYFFENYGLEL